MIARMLSLTWDIPNGCSTTSVVVIHALKTEAGIAQHNAKCQNLHCLNSINNNNSFLKFICLTISATYTCNWCLSVTAILTGGLFWIPPPAPVVVYSPWHWVVVEACLGSVISRRWTVEQKCYILNEKNSRDLNNIWLLNIPKPLALLKLFCKSEVSILPVTFKTFKPSCTSYESKRILLLLYFRFSVLKKRDLLNNSTKTKTYLYIFCFVHCNLNSLTTWYCHIIRLVPVQQQVLQVRTLLNHYLNPWIKILYIITSKNSECKAKLYIDIKKSALNCLIRLFCDLPTMKTRAPPAAALIM